MKRDIDLVRKILLAVEQGEGVIGYDTELEVEGYSREEIDYHIEIMGEAGLLVASIQRFMGGEYVVNLERMTWEGHEFLDAARNESFWSQAKAKALETTGGLGFEALKAFLLQLGTGS